MNRVNMNRVDTDKSELNRRRLLLSAGLAGAALAVGCTPDAGKSSGNTSPATTTKPTASPTTATSSPPSAKESLPAPDYHLPPIENGMAPVITKITTEQPVVFLTIDDGVTKNPELITLLQKYKYPVTLFLTKNVILDNPQYFAKFQELGNRIQNHTVNHDTTMWSKSYEYQLAEITGMQQYIETTYGTKPTLFRPPGGKYSSTMRKAVAAADIKAIVDWETLVEKGKMEYQVGNKLRPGDITLMHFRPEFREDLEAFHQAVQAANLRVARLDDFLQV